MKSSATQTNLPNGYLSYSAYTLFKKDKEEWRRIYLMGGERRQYKGTKFGKDFALARELDVESEDPDIEFARTFLPQYPQREVVMDADLGFCVIRGKFDGYDPEENLIADDKTTRKIKDNGKPGFRWTQAKVDNLKQLTWYAYIVWKKKSVIPKIELNWFDYESKKLQTFKTSRNISQFLMLHADIKKVHSEIIVFCEEVYNAI